MKKKRQHIKIIRNRKDALVGIFLVSGILVVIGGGALIYDLIQPPVHSQPLPWAETMVSLIIILLGLSFCIHGFHPFLLVQSSQRNITKLRQDKK